MSPRLALAAALSVGTPFGEVEAQDSVALEELSVEAVGDGAAPGTTTASGSIGLIGPSPGFSAARAVIRCGVDWPKAEYLLLSVAAGKVDGLLSTLAVSKLRWW